MKNINLIGGIAILLCCFLQFLPTPDFSAYNMLFRNPLHDNLKLILVLAIVVGAIILICTSLIRNYKIVGLKLSFIGKLGAFFGSVILSGLAIYFWGFSVIGIGLWLTLAISIILLIAGFVKK